ncbi:uncharacterized protein CGFF_01148 [Nakaseomyces glabratus]|nr:uncharacterized protein CGFF_01148 [Nakaseomyces glabratus]SLM11747.1 uncharacterized protein CGFF_01148 [Nakaseomyces glabratus]
MSYASKIAVHDDYRRGYKNSISNPHSKNWKNRNSVASDKSLEITAAKTALRRYSNDHVPNLRKVDRSSSGSEVSRVSTGYLSHKRISSGYSEYEIIHETPKNATDKLINASILQDKLTPFHTQERNFQNLEGGPVFKDVAVIKFSDNISYTDTDNGQKKFQENKVQYTDNIIATDVHRHEVIHLPRTLRQNIHPNKLLSSECLEIKNSKLDKNDQNGISQKEREGTSSFAKNSIVSKQNNRDTFIYDRNVDNNKAIVDDKIQFANRYSLELILNKIEVEKQELISEHKSKIDTSRALLTSQGDFIQRWSTSHEHDLEFLINDPHSDDILGEKKIVALKEYDMSRKNDIRQLVSNLASKTEELNNILTVKENRLRILEENTKANDNAKSLIASELASHRNMVDYLEKKCAQYTNHLSHINESPNDTLDNFHKDEYALLKSDLFRRKKLIHDLEEQLTAYSLKEEEYAESKNTLACQLEEQKFLLEKIRKDFSATNSAFATKPLADAEKHLMIRSVNGINDPLRMGTITESGLSGSKPAVVTPISDNRPNKSSFIDRLLIGKNAALKYRKKQLSIVKRKASNTLTNLRNSCDKPEISEPIVPIKMEEVSGGAPMRLISLTDAKVMHGNLSRGIPILDKGINTISEGYANPTLTQPRARESFFEEMF